MAERLRPTAHRADARLVRAWSPVLFCLVLLTPAVAAAEPIDDLVQQFPASAVECEAPRAAELQQAAEALEGWASRQIFRGGSPSVDEVLKTLDVVLAAKNRVDRGLDDVLNLRVEFAEMPAGPQRRERLRAFLQTTSTLIDLSGRLRYLLHDGIDAAAFHTSRSPTKRVELLDLLIRRRSGIGAGVMSILLEPPPEGSDVPPPDDAVRSKVLQLITLTGESDLLPQVAKLLRNPDTSPTLLVIAAETIRRTGLPQDPHPDQDESLPPPAVTAAELHKRLAGIDPARLSAKLGAYRRKLLLWSAQRRDRGVMGDAYRFRGHDVQAGDWLLMRNPSPYNLFTDLSPGLFTHVGVVAVDEGEDGVRRFVLVDLPERGQTIPAVNVDAYLPRTLHYFFMRHPDAPVAAAMGRAARDMVGNPTKFDLTFRTKRVEAYRGGPLRGRQIHTYCAGFLLICALQTSAPRGEFFPISELPAPGETVANLRQLGLSVGEDFVSPTGAVFSPQLQIAARRRPMYDPTREVKERIYDHFARQMRDRKLRQSPTATQALRLRLAQLAAGNPLLKQAIAKANNVSADLDLVAAAKAAAVVETLDDVADRAMNEFSAANDAFYAGPLDRLTASGAKQAAVDDIRRRRGLHADLFRRWTTGGLTPLELRKALVTHYSRQGEEHLDERFFAD